MTEIDEIIQKLRSIFSNDEDALKFILRYLKVSTSFSNEKIIEHIERTFNP